MTDPNPPIDIRDIAIQREFAAWEAMIILTPSASDAEHEVILDLWEKADNDYATVRQFIAEMEAIIAETAMMCPTLVRKMMGGQSDY